ncbi:MAG: hypothetical protein MHM6MM_008920 [Cercozoa sp. M6MM]
MGNLLSSIVKMFSGMDESRLIVVGLDAAGKTTLLYNLKLGQNIVTIPTIGFNVERLQYKNLEFEAWDIGGQEHIRKLWHHYFQNTDGIIFVVDSSDGERIDQTDPSTGNAKEELSAVLSSDELRGVPLLVMANKQDLPGAVGVSELTERLALDQLRDRKWHAQACIATTGDGIYEGLDWLADAVRDFRRDSRRS